MSSPPLSFVSQATDDDKWVLHHDIMIDRTDGDTLLFQNAVKGHIVTSKLFPLVWLDDRRLRGLDYLRNLTCTEVATLNTDEILQVGASFRDLVYTHLQGVVIAKDQEDVIGSASYALGECREVLFQMQGGLFLTPWPTRTHRVVRWIPRGQAGDSANDAEDLLWGEELFVSGKDGLIMAFCNPEDLFYHNVENIIDLKYMFEGLPPLEVTTVQDVSGNDDIITFQLEPGGSDILVEKLTQWSSFSPPFNSDQRGGKRMIFRSEQLADRLTKALHSLNINVCFGFVNSVFRLNKFQPTDDLFDAHYDTPYYDSINRQRSKYTFLLYLTAGEGEPSVLKVADYQFERLETLQGVIFRQHLEHEGRPYKEGAKLFLRSELVCDMDGEEQYDPQVARMFNIGCYHSIFHQELSAYATELFNHATKCRFEPLAEPKYKLHFRRVENIPYVTNGHDYWFDLDLPLETAAVTALVDYFDGTYKLKRFQKLLLQESVLIDKDLGNDDEKILSYIWDSYAEFPTYSKEDIMECIDYRCFEDLRVPKECSCEILCHCCDVKECTCPPLENKDNVDWFNECCQPIRETLRDYSVAIFDGSIRFNLKDIHITDSQIHFETTGYQESVWFAACRVAMRPWSDFIANPVDDIGKDVRLFHLPPIKYRRIENQGYHLVLDVFQNGWVDRQLRIPVFRNQNEEHDIPKTTDDYHLDSVHEQFTLD